MMQTMTRTLKDCPAPAKLNLFLHIVGRRADGYHLLQSVFQLIDHGDRLHFSMREDRRICRTTEVPGVPESSDLIVRAAALLQTAAIEAGRAAGGADISIDKRLPMGGGLGGGSSDAATTLIALNHLWQTGFTRGELMTLGLQLGADVPFFLLGCNAFVEGIGERLQPIETRNCWYLVIEPGVSVPTAAIFGSRQLTRDTKAVKITDFSEAHKEGRGFGRNDMQIVAALLFPPVAEAVEWLGKFGNARMTGSGACVFCPFEEEREVDEVLKAVPAHWKAWKAKSLERHPLAHLLQS
jgi:4-diphosphocytidyl-2-C-methyl-D-erythritol kinase